MRLPTRALIGARTNVLTLSRGEGAVTSSLEGYAPRAADIELRHRGSLVASDTGQVTAYSLVNLEDRGQFFVAPGEQVYAGMVVGENNKDKDITLNVVRPKKMTNVRASSKDNTEKVKAANKMSLEQFLEYLDRDELLEVTPQTLRLRKRLMNEKARLRAGKEAPVS
jgi:GTP-binding protein